MSLQHVIGAIDSNSQRKIESYAQLAVKFGIEDLTNSLERNRELLSNHQEKLKSLIYSGKNLEHPEVTAAVNNVSMLAENISLLIPAINMAGGEAEFRPEEAITRQGLIEDIVNDANFQLQTDRAIAAGEKAKIDKAKKEEKDRQDRKNKLLINPAIKARNGSIGIVFLLALSEACMTHFPITPCCWFTKFTHYIVNLITAA